jgi:ubiquinone/menaquinone biosynthesis C-methylase UbiE
VGKALELAFIRRNFLTEINTQQDKIVELAVGDGSFSRIIFAAQAAKNVQITGLDLNPYSLYKTRHDQHIGQRVIGDCIEPPLPAGQYDWLMANNFLHHITHKEEALTAWSKIAAHAVFNENTVYWASSWTIPYLLRKMGAVLASAKVTKKIETISYQKLLTGEALAQLVKQSFIVKKQEGYLDTHTFFLCSIFSFLLRCYGPPTPAFLKKLILSPGLGWFRFLILSLTRKVAELLIFFDSCRSRQKDVFISYLGQSKNYQPLKERLHQTIFFKCPRCGGGVEQHYCTQCKKEYQIKDNMLFLLAEENKHILESYNPAVHKKVPVQHL